MTPVSRLGRQISEVAVSLEAINVEWALIGGLALTAYKVIRATQDVDVLIDIDRSDDVDREMQRLDYECIHRSHDAANYVRAHERVDFLYASRPLARKLLLAARTFQTSLGVLRVISPEGLIGFKLQAVFNNPQRTQDLVDIRKLVAANRDSLDLVQLRDYFRLFQREGMLDELTR